jgi:hypothetical protein
MLIAQAVGEYGGMSSLAAVIQSWITNAEVMITGFGAKEYAVIGVVAVALLAFLSRRR